MWKKSDESIICEKHLYTIMFGLEDALKIYKSEIEEYELKPYLELSAEEIHLKKWYESKAYDASRLLAEINLTIEDLS